MTTQGQAWQGAVRRQCDTRREKRATGGDGVNGSAARIILTLTAILLVPLFCAAQDAGSNSQPPPDAPTPQLPASPPPPKPINWYMRFTNGPQVKPLTPREKAWLALRNVVDPFNAVTILGTSAISVGSDPGSPYGPGMPGFARSVGV